MWSACGSGDLWSDVTPIAPCPQKRHLVAKSNATVVSLTFVQPLGQAGLWSDVPLCPQPSIPSPPCPLPPEELSSCQE